MTFFVEVSGFEPLTPAMSRRYSNQLSYTSKDAFLKKRCKDTGWFYFSMPIVALFFIMTKFS
jgi:hypothetical protein